MNALLFLACLVAVTLLVIFFKMLLKNSEKNHALHAELVSFILFVSVVAILIFLLCLFITPAQASTQCKGKLFNPLSAICWKCFFPITIGKAVVTPSQLPDAPNPSKTICHCGSNPFKGWGLAVGYWVPTTLIDVTRHPYCMVTLGGWQLPIKNVLNNHEGEISNNSATNNHSFYYFHYIAIPFMDLFAGFFGGTCHPHSGAGIRYMSELDPAWHDEKLNAVMYPEITPVVTNIISSQAAEITDCIAATAHLPLDSIYWAAGCQGTLYPIEGEVQEHASSAQASTLIAERGLLLLHRLGFIADSSKDSLCGENYSYYLPKSRYRYQLMYPVQKSCYPLGHSTALWEIGVTSALSTEDYAYVVWKKRNCCSSGI